MNKNDLRVEKTIVSIQQALLALMSEKALSKITITELAKRAKIQRKTFYLHYQSINDVLSEFEVELGEAVRQLIMGIKPFAVRPFIVGLNELFLKNYEFYEQILTNKQNLVLSINSKNTLREVLMADILAHNHALTTNEVETDAEFIAAGIVNAYSNWLMKHDEWPLNELIDYLVRLVDPIFKQVGITPNQD